MDPETARKAVTPELVNAMNYPDKARAHLLGRDMGPLIDRVVNAVVNAEPVPLRKFDSDGHEVVPYYLRAVVAEGKLTRIRDLCDEAERTTNPHREPLVATSDILAILDAEATLKEPEPDDTWPADTAQVDPAWFDSLPGRREDPDFELPWNEETRPPQDSDRDALLSVLRKHGGYDKQEAADEILALVRPVGGILLSPEERDRVTGWFVKLGEPPCEILPEDRALFARLEASS